MLDFINEGKRTISGVGKQLAGWGECFGVALVSNTINAWTIIELPYLNTCTFVAKCAMLF